MDLIPPLGVLTPASAAGQMTSKRLDAFGLVMPVLSAEWSDTEAGVIDDDHLTLSIGGGLKAPFHGAARYLDVGQRWRDVAGQPITDPVFAIEMLPEAARRLTTLLTTRLGAPLVHPVPVAMLMHRLTWQPPAGSPPGAKPAVQSVRAGDVFAPLPAGNRLDVTFHDACGLPIDPIAVAALFADLIAWQPALGVGSAGNPGGLNQVLGLDVPVTPVRYHLVSPHGVLCTPTADMGLAVSGGASPDSIDPSTGTVSLTAGQSLGPPAGSGAGVVYWGFSPNGFLAQQALSPPTLPAGVNLPRQFFRVVVVNMNWHLLGNRTASAIRGVPGDPATPPPSYTLPTIRPRVPGFAYLADGMDVLGAMGQISANFPTPGRDVLPLLCSPAIDAALALPPVPGQPGHWPAFPPPVPVPTTGIAAGFDLAKLASAAFRNPTDAAGANRDVVVTFAADPGLPPGTHLRVFPRSFVAITAITAEQPSFVRGDGGAAIVGTGATKLLLVNPYNLAVNDPLSTDPLTVDIVATGRDGSRRTVGSVQLHPQNAPVETWTGTLAQFGGTAFLTTPVVAAATGALGVTAVAPVTVFGIPAPPPAPGPTPSTILDAVRKLANEASPPRIGPHLPTQARFETILALGTAGTADPRYVWQAVLSGGRWTWETRSARAELADPGNPAGPDVFASGVQVGGALGYDLALHTLKRAEPILPLGAGAFGWLAVTDGNNWSPPAADTTGTVAGAMLETVAPFVDSPELSLLPAPTPGDTVQNAVNAIAAQIGVPAPMVTVANEQQLLTELERESQTASNGQHEALLSLARAIAQAEDYVYIEGPAFSATSFGNDGGLDLVALLDQRLTAVQRLKVVICVPRLPDFTPTKANWMRAAFAQRAAAITKLSQDAPGRVIAFSPVGFPGRWSAIRSTVVLVDDVFALVGASHFRRRGMTFDGSVSVASIDRQLDGWGVSASIAAFRQMLVARKLGVDVPAGPAVTTALWTRLSRPESMFAALTELLAEGGQGYCSPVWAGPTDTTVIPQTDDISDPNGLDASADALLGLYEAVILEA
ncbi:MAG TPA: hypothetical protein VH496_06380 [Mycobacterium sp.]